MPPVETSSKPMGDEPVASSTRPVLSLTDRSARRGTGSSASARATSIVTCRPSVVTAPASMSATDPRQEPVLDGLDPRLEARLVVAGQDRDRLLGDDRAAVERRVDEVDGRPGHGRPVGERVAHGMRARERRQERRMRVDDPARIRGERHRPDEPHVAGQHDEVRRAPRRSASANASSAPPGRARYRSPARSPSRGPGRRDRPRRARSGRRARRAAPRPRAPGGCSRRR